MDEATAKKTVTAVALIVAVIVFWENLTNTGNVIPPAKTVVTFLVLLTGLTVGASLAPEIFGPLSLLVGTAVAISRMPSSPGPFLQRYGGQKPPSTVTPPSSGTVGQTPSGGQVI